MTFITKQEALTFLKEKFPNNSDIEINYWLRIIPSYDEKRNYLFPYHFYNQEEINEFIPNKDNNQLVLSKEYSGIISGLQALAILRKKHTHATDFEILGLWFPAFDRFVQAENNNYIAIHSFDEVTLVIDKYEKYCYLIHQIEGFKPNSHQRCISYQALKTRKLWEDLKDLDVTRVLIEQLHEKKLQLYPADYSIPFILTDGTIYYNTTVKTIVSKAYPGSKEEKILLELIRNDKTVFLLSHIENMEKKYLGHHQEKIIRSSIRRAPNRASQEKKERIEEAFINVLNYYKQESRTPNNKQAVAKRIWQSINNNPSSEKLSNSEINTIIRKLSDLQYQQRVNALKNNPSNQ